MKKNFGFAIVFLAFASIIYLDSGAQTTGAQKMAAFQKQKSMIAASPYKNLQWRLAGPDNRSGRCTDVAGWTGDPNLMYVGYATGGLWKTEDGGTNWSPLFDKQATLSIGSIAIAPSNKNIVFVGTGEANIFRSSLPGTGIYKTKDGGKSFQHLGLENTGTIARIVVNPYHSEVVYVAASGNEWTYNKDRGVFQTMDGGKTWKKILFLDEKTGCIDLVMDPSNPSILYASMWNRIRRRWSDPVPEDGDHIYKSIDGGKTWKITDKGLPDTKMTGRIGLAVSFSNPNIVYAFVDDHTKKRDPKPGETDSYERQVQKVVIGGAIYRSTDKGENWEKMGEIHDFFKPFSGTYGWVFSQIRVDPKNENQLYVMGVSMGKSTDGGKTWKQFVPTDTVTERMGGDNHALWIDKEDPQRMILGNDGGVSMTNDGGNSWNNFWDKMPTTQFYTVTYDMETPFNVFGAIQDQGTFSGSSARTFGETSPPDDKRRKWNYAPGGEGTQIQVDPLHSNIVYSSTYYGRLMKSDLNKRDSTRSKRIKNFLVGAIDSLRGEWLAGTLMSRFENTTIYHGLQHLYKSVDSGENWTMISQDLSYNDPKRMGKYPYLIYHQAITAIAEGRAPGLLYAGTDDGRVWVLPGLDQNPANWKELTAGLPYNKHVAKICTSYFDDSLVYVVLNGRRDDDASPLIYKRKGLNGPWVMISGNLPNSPVNVIIEDWDKKNVLYCGTDMGVYISKDAGKTWLALNGNMPVSVAVDDMFIHPRDKKLVLGTYGRGIWILDKKL